MAKPAAKRRTWSTRYPLAVSAAAFLFLAVIIGFWSVKAKISGAVIGKGTVEVASTMTAVQHPVGGVVDQILATNGDKVLAGDVVVRLEDVQLRSDLKVVEGELFEVLANIARLEAAIDGRETLDLHPALAEAAQTQPEVAVLVERQQRQLTASFDFLTTEAELLDEQVSQVRAQVSGMEAQVAAKETEKRYIDAEMIRLSDLDGKGLVRHSDVFAQQRAQASVEGEIGRLTANVAELRGKISELELKRHTIVPKERKLAVAELSKLRPQRTRFLERRASLQDKLTKLEIRAPISGKVHDTRVLGVRSVVVAASPLMMIVPDSEPAMVSVRIGATDIDQVFHGQEASLKFKAFDRRHIPIVLGSVARISADAFLDTTTRKSYYEVTLTLSDEELAKLGDRELLPGMPVDAFLSTDSRTPLNYVLQPLLTYIDRAFRDA